jgi:cobalt-zinc-cadmium efflux system outer membrane protein
LSLLQAKALLLKQNLQVLATHFDLEVADANLLQARAWNNPYFNWNQDLYSLEKNQYFNFNNQFLIQIDQVFSIAGKYTKTIKVAKLQKEGTRLQAQDIVRALMYECSQLFQEGLKLQAKQTLYKETEESYQQIIRSAQQQNRLGALSNKELIRLQSELLSNQTESASNATSLHQTVAQLKILLNLKAGVELVFVGPDSYPSQAPPLPQILENAELNRADYLLAKNQIQVSDAQVSLQRASAVPDITFGYQPKDRGSNYVRPYSGIEVGFEVPLFHRNAGKIKSVQAQRKKAEVESNQKVNQLQNEVTSSLKIFMQNRLSFERYDPAFMQEIEKLQSNAEQNYLNRNINILEYIDIKRNYIQNKMQYVDVCSKLLESAGYVNFVAGTQIIP